jgi:ATP-binding cassette subfamily F protein 3
MESVSRCRGILGAFLFSGDDAEKRISVLSGGERNRAALAKMLLAPSNLLLLDEPTNHLDMESCEVLLEALDGYEGTIIVVSHDRHFINALATRVVHLEDGRLTDYLGDYEYYAFKRAEERAAATTGTPASVADGGAESRGNRKEERRRAAEVRAEVARRTRELKAEVARLEAEIARHEAKVTEIESVLANPSNYLDPKHDFGRLGRDLSATRTALEAAMAAWEQKGAELEAAEREARAAVE